MGVDIHVKICKYDEESNFYKEICLYRFSQRLNKYIKIDPYDVRDYEMFEGMQNGDETDGYGTFPWRPILLNSLDPNLREEMQKEMDEAGVYGFHEISFPEIENYLFKHPYVTDYDSNEWDLYDEGKMPKPIKENPIKYFYKNCKYYADFATNDYFTFENDFKLLIWFDH